MSTPKDPVDSLGNPIIKEGFVTVQFNTVPIFKVIAVERGGFHTAQGVTPALIRIVCDMTLRQVPGVPFSSLARLVDPSSQTMIEGIADTLRRS